MSLRLSSFVIAVMIISFMMVGFYSIIGDLASNNAYDITVNESYSNSFDKTNTTATEIKNDYEEIFGNSEDNETGWYADVSSYLGLIPNSLSLVKNMIVLPYQATSDMISSVTEFLSLPDWINVFITVCVIILVMFGLISIINKYRYT